MWRQANLMGFGTWLSWSQPWKWIPWATRWLTWNLCGRLQTGRIVAGCCWDVCICMNLFYSLVKEWLAMILGETVSPKKRVPSSLTGVKMLHVETCHWELRESHNQSMLDLLGYMVGVPLPRGSWLGYTVTPWCTHRVANQLDQLDQPFSVA